MASCSYIYIYVAGAFRNGKLCRITKFSQEVVKIAVRFPFVTRKQSYVSY